MAMPGNVTNVTPSKSAMAAVVSFCPWSVLEAAGKEHWSKRPPTIDIYRISNLDISTDVAKYYQ